MTLGTARVWLTKPTKMAAWDDWGANPQRRRLTPFLGVSQPERKAFVRKTSRTMHAWAGLTLYRLSGLGLRHWRGVEPINTAPTPDSECRHIGSGVFC